MIKKVLRKLTMVKHVLQDPLKKNYFTMIKELISYSIQEKRFVKEYFTYFIYQKGSIGLENYVPEKIIFKFWENKELYPKELTKNLNNKLFFYQVCKANGINTPEVLAYNEFNNFYINDELRVINNVSEFTVLLKELIAKEKSETIFIKPIAGMEGIGCYRITLERVNNDGFIQKIFEDVVKESFLFQSFVVQHKDVNVINPSSVSTIRFSVYIKDDGEVEIFSAFMRVGRSGREVDNIAQGGYFAPIDLNTGKFSGPGIQELMTGYKTYTHSIETNTLIEGYQLPNFDEAKELVIKAVKAFQLRLTGWDISLAEDGPIAIEGNTNYAINCSDLAHGGYMNLPVFLEVIEKFGQ